MGMIESEFLTGHFENLVQVLASAAAIPAPTFPVLGADRLVGNLSWNSLKVVEGRAELQPPAGFILAKAALRIGHVSIAELTANAAAMTFTDATAWLFVGVSAAPHRLTIDIARIDIPGQPQSAPFAPPLPLAKQPEPLDLPGGVVPLGQALLVSDGVCTIRFVTSADENLFAAPANRASAVFEGWAVHVSGQVIAEQLLGQLREALKKLPADVEVETQPAAAWMDLPIGQSGWGAYGGFGVKKIDACADVDISIEVGASVTLSIDHDANTFTSRFHVSTDVSDWDSFRCWLAKGGLVAAVLLPPLGIVSLAGVGFVIGQQAGETLTGNGPGDDWKMVSSTDTSATYELVAKLPKPGPTANIGSDTSVGEAGLVVTGDMNAIPLAVHAEPHFTPDGGDLEGSWVGAFSCKQNNWGQAYELPYIEIIDRSMIASTVFARLPVKVFATSSAVPPALWSIEAVKGGFDETAHVVCHAQASDYPATPPFLTPPRIRPKPSGFAFVHTSAGIKRFDLAAIQPSRVPPDEIQMAPMRMNCRNFGNAWRDPRIVAGWLVDPPELDFGHPALRHWQLTISDIPRGASITFHGIRDGLITERLASVTADEGGQSVIEIVTDARTELSIEHTLKEAPAGARLSQRWLLPTQVAEFHGVAAGLAQDGNNVHVVGSERLATLSMLTGHAHRETKTPLSLTLSDGRVAAIHGNSLVIAIPYGGTAARAMRQAASPMPTLA